MPLLEEIKALKVIYAVNLELSSEGEKRTMEGEKE